MADSYFEIQNCIYELVDFLRGLPETRVFYGRGGNLDRTGTIVENDEAIGVICTTPGNRYFPVNRKDVISLANAYNHINIDKFAVEFSFKPSTIKNPSGNCIVAVHLGGNLDDVIRERRFQLTVTKRSTQNNRIEAKSEFSNQRFLDMRKSIRNIETFLDNEVRS